MMKRLEAMALVFVGIFVIIIGLFYCLNPFLVAQTDTFQLSPLNEAIGGIEYRRYYGEQQGNRVLGTLTITGGDESVWFRIEDPYGGTIVDVGAVKHTLLNIIRYRHLPFKSLYDYSRKGLASDLL